MIQGWKLKILGEIAEVHSGGTPLTSRNEYWFGDIPWYSSGELNETFTKTPKQLITPKGLEESNAKIFPNGSLLIGMYDTAALKMSILDRDAAFNQAIAGVKPNENIDLKFILFAINSRRVEILNLRRGVRQKNLSLAKIKNIALPIPPLPEQKRIVAILDEAFEGIERAIANTEKNLANSRELFESYLNAIFIQKGDGWVEKKLGDSELIQIIDGDRGTNYPQKSDFLNAGHCLFLNTKNVRPDGFNFETTMFITEEKDNFLRKGKLKRRDVILTTRGTIGNIAIYNDSVEFEHIRINSGMLIFRPNENLIKSEYLFEILRSSIMKSQIEKFTSGAAQPQLPIKTLVSFSFPVPISLEEQSRIVSNLQELSTETQRLETIYRQKLVALNELKQSILQKAFTGELTADTPKTVKEKIAA